jgi:hypothetical protein
MSEVLVNKVAESGLITLNLEAYLPKGGMVTFDLKDHLFMGLILKEKDFREALKGTDWTSYEGKSVAVTCTADAIIPLWAYMLVVTYLQPVAEEVLVGTEADLYRHIVLKNIAAIDTAPLQDARVVVKGCGDITIEAYAYGEVTRVLRPVVKSIMYGEPCSTVPIYKKK